MVLPERSGERSVNVLTPLSKCSGSTPGEPPWSSGEKLPEPHEFPEPPDLFIRIFRSAPGASPEPVPEAVWPYPRSPSRRPSSLLGRSRRRGLRRRWRGLRRRRGPQV